MTGEIYKVKVERTCKNGECFLFGLIRIEIHTFWAAKNPWEKLV